MGNPILQLGDSLRRIQSEQTLKRIEPQIKEIRADYERQIAERDAQIEDRVQQIADRDAQITALSAEIKRLREENAAPKDEINTNRVQNEPAPKKKKAARE